MRRFLMWLASIANSLFNGEPVTTRSPALREFLEWCEDTRRRHLKSLAKHPHHYAVAGGLTLFLLAVGAYEMTAICTLWGYAILENLTSLD